MENQGLRRVHVIIPAFNEADVIEDCLKGLVAQKFQDFKATIVNDESTDSTRDIVLSYARRFPDLIELKEFGKVGPGRARNLVARDSRSEFLAFTDADCIPTRDWISSIISVLDQNIDAGSCGGPHLAPAQSNPFQSKVEGFFKGVSWLVDFYKHASSQPHLTRHNPLCNVFYRRELFLKLGGFREDLFPGEDFEFDERLRRAGVKIWYHPGAIVFHHRPESIARFKKVMFAYGRSQGRLVRERGPHRLVHWLGLLLLLPVGVIRPLGWTLSNSESVLGVWWGSLDWFAGFGFGLCTKKSR